MDIPGATFWWIAAGVAVVAELGTGTFYLLMIALGLAAAALAAYAGLSASSQLAVAAIVGGGATVAWHWHRLRNRSDDAPTPENRDVNLDIGAPVHVTAWAPDRTAHVRYRGSAWMARLTPGAQPQAGAHVITAVEGNWLVLTPVGAH